MKESKLPEVLREQLEKGAEAYKHVLENNEFDYYRIPIDCSLLPVPLWQKGTPLPEELHPFFSELHKNDKDKGHINTKACVYYFEIESPVSEEILAAYKSFKQEERHKGRASATLKKVPPSTSVLYVGKVKSDIGGRMVVHLGYYHVGATAGLQLACWAKEIGLKLIVHIYAFESKMHDFIDPLELPFARSLQPLIGKH